MGREIRRAFVAHTGNVLLSADYSQVELRILAHICEDEYLLAAFARGEDIHASAAAKVYGVPLSQVTKEQRSVAKMMNFDLLRGQRVRLGAADSDLPLSSGPVHAALFRHLSRVQANTSRKVNWRASQGYVETLLGRRRFFRSFTQATGQQANAIRQPAEREATNIRSRARQLISSRQHFDSANLPWETVRAALQPIFADPRTAKIAHNASYDLGMLARYGLNVAGDLVDTMVAEWLIDPGSRGLGLKDLAWTRLNVEMTPISALIGAGKNQITMDKVPAETAGAYASADAAMTLRLAEILLPELEQKGLTSLFRDVEMPLVPVLVAMEAAGVKVDVPILRQMSVDLTRRLRELEKEIQQIAGYPFNVNSTQQLADVLFGKLGLPTEGLKKTQAGSYSTAADVLEGLRGRHEIIELILEQRQLSKLIGTYVDALPGLVNPRTGRLHTSFNQAGAETGRLSSTNPNLQNIPIRSEVGREIRRAFIADAGNVLLSADYSQVELRILAHICEDEYLLAAFARGEDIHASAAAKVYGVPLGQVTKEQRSVAKMMNFATSYGVTAFGLAQRTGLSRSEADQFMQRYFAMYPGVKRYIEETRKLAREQGFVETLLGRRRFFPVLRTQATGQQANAIRQAAERAAINHPIQGTAADIIKIAMSRLFRALNAGGYRARLTLQVHDELVLEVPEAELIPVSRLVKETMEGAYHLNAKLKVDMEAGLNWYEMEPVPV